MTETRSKYRVWNRQVTISLELFDKDLDVARWFRDMLAEEPWVANVPRVKASKAMEGAAP